MKTSFRFRPKLSFVFFVFSFFFGQSSSAQSYIYETSLMAEYRPTAKKWDIQPNENIASSSSEKQIINVLSMTVTPEPNTEVLSFQLAGMTEAGGVVTIFGHTGEDVFRQEIAPGTQTFRLDPVREKIDAGEYFVTIRTGQQQVTEMVFIQNGSSHSVSRPTKINSF